MRCLYRAIGCNCAPQLQPILLSFDRLVTGRVTERMLTLRIDPCLGNGMLNRSSCFMYPSSAGTKLIISWRIFRTDGGFAKNMADIEYARRVLRRKSRSIGGQRPPAFLDRYGKVRPHHRQSGCGRAKSAPMPIRSTQAGLSSNEYAHFKYIQKYAMLDGGSCHVRCR